MAAVTERERACAVCGVGGASGAGGAVPRLAFRKDGFDVWRCPGCGLGWVEPMPRREELAAFYAQGYYRGGAFGYPEGYEQLAPGLERTYRGLLRRLARRHPGRHFARVLDVGCAYGVFLDVARAQCRASELVGLDVTAEAEQHVRAKGYDFVRGFAEDAELPRAHFDLVFVGDAFEHVVDPGAVVARFAEILAPGGVVLLTTIDFGSWLARWKRERWRLMTPPEHLWFWTRRALRAFFAARGLDGPVERYWLWYPKEYVQRRVQEQFGFGGALARLWPGALVPVPSVDVLCGMFARR